MTETDDDDVTGVLDRVKTGVEAFDELVMGGLPRGRTTVVGGTPGSGKTVFATQFLVNGITSADENGVFVTFEEPPREIENNMRSFGWDLHRWRKEKRLASSLNPRSAPRRQQACSHVSACLTVRKRTYEV